MFLFLFFKTCEICNALLGDLSEVVNSVTCWGFSSKIPPQGDK